MYAIVAWTKAQGQELIACGRLQMDGSGSRNRLEVMRSLGLNLLKPWPGETVWCAAGNPQNAWANTVLAFEAGGGGIQLIEYTDEGPMWAAFMNAIQCLAEQEMRGEAGRLRSLAQDRNRSLDKIAGTLARIAELMGQIHAAQAIFYDQTGTAPWDSAGRGYRRNWWRRLWRKIRGGWRKPCQKPKQNHSNEGDEPCGGVNLRRD